MDTVTSSTNDPGTAPSSQYCVVSLPPCRVCGEKSSGYHYGVITCTACKAFYKRSITRKSELQCHLNGQCNIRSNRRHACPACRYKKCRDVGMSKSAIRTGRYPTEVVTSNILEVKKLHLQERITKQGSLIVNSQDWTNDVQACITHLTNVHYNSHPQLAQRFNSLPETEAQFLEKKHLENLCFGSRAPIPAAEHAEIFAQTGLDVGGRRSLFLQLLLSADSKLQAYAVFTDALPGMSQIPLDDKKAIFRASSVDRWAFLFHGWYNADAQLMTFPHGTMFVMDVGDPLMYTEQPENWRVFWALMHRIQLLELSEEEAVMCAALSTVCADAEVSSTTRLIMSQSEELLTSALLYLITCNHDPHEQTLPKIIAIMCELRNMYTHYIRVNRMVAQTLPDVALSELFRDMVKL